MTKVERQHKYLGRTFRVTNQPTPLRAENKLNLRSGTLVSNIYCRVHIRVSMIPLGQI